LGLKYRNTNCIHGHFLPYKYASFYAMKNVQFVTWLREPLDRLASHYLFWQRNYNANTTVGKLHKRVVQESWSFEKFCLSHEMQNTYAQFLYKFPITQFNFVGITEHFETDLRFFAKQFLGLDDVNIPTENKSPEKTKDFFTDATFKKAVQDFHKIDLEIYHKALEMRASRVKI